MLTTPPTHPSLFTSVCRLRKHLTLRNLFVIASLSFFFQSSLMMRHVQQDATDNLVSMTSMKVASDTFNSPTSTGASRQPLYVVRKNPEAKQTGIERCESAPAEKLRGIHQDYRKYYCPENTESTLFECLSADNEFVDDGGTPSILHVTLGDVNDGYCDCLDGSDEPGTSACNGISKNYFLHRKDKEFAWFSNFYSHVPPVLQQSFVCSAYLDHPLEELKRWEKTGEASREQITRVDNKQQERWRRVNRIDRRLKRGQDPHAYSSFQHRSMKVISTGMVDDGVCDCCDGSDERTGTCESVCQ